MEWFHSLLRGLQTSLRMHLNSFVLWADRHRRRRATVFSQGLASFVSIRHDRPREGCEEGRATTAAPDRCRSHQEGGARHPVASSGYDRTTGYLIGSWLAYGWLTLPDSRL
jgi:hypothetical protein